MSSIRRRINQYGNTPGTIIRKKKHFFFFWYRKYYRKHHLIGRKWYNRSWCRYVFIIIIIVVVVVVVDPTTCCHRYYRYQYCFDGVRHVSEITKFIQRFVAISFKNLEIQIGICEYSLANNTLTWYGFVVLLLLLLLSRRFHRKCFVRLVVVVIVPFCSILVNIMVIVIINIIVEYIITGHLCYAIVINVERIIINLMVKAIV